MDMKEMKERYPTVTSGVFSDIPPQAETVEELMNLENSLKSSNDLRKLIQTFTRIGGGSTRENAKKILQRLATNEVMASFNMQGRKGKLSFAKMKLFSVVKDAVVETRGCTENEAEVAIGTVLKYAPDRRGGGGRKN